MQQYFEIKLICNFIDQNHITILYIKIKDAVLTLISFRILFLPEQLYSYTKNSLHMYITLIFLHKMNCKFLRTNAMREKIEIIIQSLWDR